MFREAEIEGGIFGSRCLDAYHCCCNRIVDCADLFCRLALLILHLIRPL